MNKREFLKFPLAALIAQTSPASSKGINQDGISFKWWHERYALTVLFTAPTKGWLAVGFNEVPTLKNTRFVIAAVSTTPIRVEEHVALIPEHHSVKSLGLPAALKQFDGSFQGDTSTLMFTLPHKIPGRAELDLAPGSSVHLMLAWSMEIDFNHHSAWRRHFTLTL